MPSLTIRNVPEELLERLRARAEADRRSLTQEVIHLLENALRAGGATTSAADAQADAWAALGGRWQSDESKRREISSIYRKRTRGRKIDL